MVILVGAPGVTILAHLEMLFALVPPVTAVFLCRPPGWAPQPPQESSEVSTHIAGDPQMSPFSAPSA